MNLSPEVVAEIEQLAPAVWQETRSDRLFFRRRPHRKFRLRRCFPNELRTARLFNSTQPIPLGSALFVVVRSVGPGRLLRAHVVGPAEADTDVPERWAKALYDMLADREAEALLINMNGWGDDPL